MSSSGSALDYSLRITAVLLVGPQPSQDVEAQEAQDDPALCLSEVEGLPVEVASWVLEEAKSVLHESSLVSAVDGLLGHLFIIYSIGYSEFLHLPIVGLPQGPPDHLQSLVFVGSVVIEVVLTEGSGLGVSVSLVVLSQPQIISLHLLVLSRHSKS